MEETPILPACRARPAAILSSPVQTGLGSQRLSVFRRRALTAASVSPAALAGRIAFRLSQEGPPFATTPVQAQLSAVQSRLSRGRPTGFRRDGFRPVLLVERRLFGLRRVRFRFFDDRHVAWRRRRFFRHRGHQDPERHPRRRNYGDRKQGRRQSNSPPPARKPVTLDHLLPIGWRRTTSAFPMSLQLLTRWLYSAIPAIMSSARRSW